MTRTIFQAYNEVETVDFLTLAEAEAFKEANTGFEIREFEQQYPLPTNPKTAKDYLDFASKFFQEFSQDCIDAGNTIEINDELGLHFADMNAALHNGRLDKFYSLLVNSQPLLPFYTQERKEQYIAKLQAFFGS